MDLPIPAPGPISAVRRGSRVRFQNGTPAAGVARYPAAAAPAEERFAESTTGSWPSRRRSGCRTSCEGQGVEPPPPGPPPPWMAKPPPGLNAFIGALKAGERESADSLGRRELPGRDEGSGGLDVHLGSVRAANDHAVRAPDRSGRTAGTWSG